MYMYMYMYMYMDMVVSRLLLYPVTAPQNGSTQVFLWSG